MNTRLDTVCYGDKAWVHAVSGGYTTMYYEDIASVHVSAMGSRGQSYYVYWQFEPVQSESEALAVCAFVTAQTGLPFYTKDLEYVLKVYPNGLTVNTLVQTVIIKIS